jgi:hypothetical protein
MVETLRAERPIMREAEFFCKVARALTTYSGSRSRVNAVASTPRGGVTCFRPRSSPWCRPPGSRRRAFRSDPARTPPKGEQATGSGLSRALGCPARSVCLLRLSTPFQGFWAFKMLVAPTRSAAQHVNPDNQEDRGEYRPRTRCRHPISCNRFHTVCLISAHSAELRGTAILETRAACAHLLADGKSR